MTIFVAVFLHPTSVDSQVRVFKGRESIAQYFLNFVFRLITPKLLHLEHLLQFYKLYIDLGFLKPDAQEIVCLNLLLFTEVPQ